jgi:hypothetical protein
MITELAKRLNQAIEAHNILDASPEDFRTEDELERTSTEMGLLDDLILFSKPENFDELAILAASLFNDLDAALDNLSEPIKESSHHTQKWVIGCRTAAYEIARFLADSGLVSRYPHLEKYRGFAPNPAPLLECAQEKKAA